MFKELSHIQAQLKAPKGQFNRFGGFRYRSQEDILQAVKPLLLETGCCLTLDDEVRQVGERFYVRSTATLTNKEGAACSVSAWAREELGRKGMDAAQVTGSASSYARKYALCGLLCIDNSKDPDAEGGGSSPATAEAEAEAEAYGGQVAAAPGAAAPAQYWRP